MSHHPRRAIFTFVALVTCLTFAHIAPADDDLAPLSDDFNDAKTLPQWQRVFRVEHSPADQLERIDINRSQPGRLLLMPHTSTWYQDYRGVLIHKSVTGDFIVTTKVKVARRNNQPGAPTSSFSLAGIMIRAPRDITPATWRPGGENYVFLSLGAANEPSRFAFEVKTTRNSDSQLQITPTETNEAEIRIARIGPHLILMRRINTEAWQIHHRYHRPDLPGALQVGMTVYTDYASASRLPPPQHNQTVIRTGRPDLVAGFDYFRFARPALPHNLRNANLSDAGAVSDAQLLRFLGDAK